MTPSARPIHFAGSVLEAQRHVCAFFHTPVIIIVSAHGSDDVRARASRAGAVAFLPKPFDGDLLLDAVRSALHESERRVSSRDAGDTRRKSWVRY